MKKWIKIFTLISGVTFASESYSQEFIIIDLSGVDSTNIDSVFRSAQMKFLEYQKKGVFDDFTNEIKWHRVRLEAIEKRRQKLKKGGAK